MRRVSKFIGIVGISALGALGFTTWLYAMVPKPGMHMPDAACASCHLAGPATTASNAAMLVASQEQLCGGCHANSLQMSHPSGVHVQQGKTIPAVYPTDWKGDITCSTCHEVHTTHNDLPGRLRGTVRGRDLCISCHDKTFFNKMSDGGESLMQAGHLSTLDSQNWANLDAYSIQCMECHGTKGDVQVDSSHILRHANKNHPIGVSYAEAERFGGYTPAYRLPAFIHLPGGMMSCVSCHEAYTKNHGKVVNASSGTELCLECHNL